MKRTLIVFMALLSAFFVLYGIKVRHAINRPVNQTADYQIPWYEAKFSSLDTGDEWILDPEIPVNYIPVPGNQELYMVIGDDGKITGYRQRTKQIDGSWNWTDTNAPDTGIHIAAVKDKGSLFKFTDEEVVSYQKYIRNPDNSYAFVETDENGTELDIGTSADLITDMYQQYSDNIYSLYNEYGVLLGYRERVLDEGQYYWREADLSSSSGTGLTSLKERLHQLTGSTENPSAFPDDAVLQETLQDGSYTVTKKSTNTVTENGCTVMYETVIYYTYDAEGNLLNTRKEGPVEVSRTATGSGSAIPDRNLIAASLDGEYTRVAAQVSFNTGKAREVLEFLNQERRAQGKTALTMDTGSESYKIACIKAADMCIYGYCATQSPMYGTVEDMIGRWGCSSNNPSENIWRAGNKSAEEIHTRLQNNDGSRLIRMSDYTEVGIAVIDDGNNTYTAEIFLK